MPAINHGVSCGDTYFMVMTPTRMINDLPVGRVLAPFPTMTDAEDAVALLERRYPGNVAGVGSSQYTADYDADQLEKLYQDACGDLAAELAGIPIRRMQ